MFDNTIIGIICYVTGNFVVRLLGGGKYVTSSVEDLLEPFATESTKRLPDGKVLVREDMVMFIGGMFWFFVFAICIVGFLTGWFDVIAPFRRWLFGQPVVG